MLTHLFFDFFGTLVDYSASRTEQGYRESHQLLTDAGSDLRYEQYLVHLDENAGRIEAEAEKSLVEYSMHDVCGEFLRQVFDSPPPADLLERYIARYIAEWNRGVVDLPGLPAMLERLGERYTLVVITNTHSTTLVPEHLERIGVASHFEAVITSLEHGRRKPHPELFRHAMSRFDVNAANCAYIGDSFHADYRGSRGAGMAAYLIDPHSAADVPTRARLSSVLELEQRLDGDT